MGLEEEMKKSLFVQGTDDIAVSQEVKDYFEGRGISMEFLRKHYGVGRSLCIIPEKK